MSAGLSDWLANATVEDLAWACFALAIGLGFATGCAVYLLRHRGEQ